MGVSAGDSPGALFMIKNAAQYHEQVLETADCLGGAMGSQPTVGVVLGTGMTAFVEASGFSVAGQLPYEDIPYFAQPTLESHHKGLLLWGTLHGKHLMVLQGRLHYYEGYSMQEITHPIRVMKALGVRTLFICNAAGGINPDLSLSDVMLITDHINLLPDNPLRGQNIDSMGARFPDMFRAYSPRLLGVVRKEASHYGPLREGVYAAVMGPNLETPAEYRYLATMGADAVGMSTVPEVIVAVHMQMEVCALSIITDLCYPAALQEVSVSKILQAVEKGEPQLVRILSSAIENS